MYNNEARSQKITVSAFLHKDGKLFIAKRAATKKFLPGKFELPGGHVEHDEAITEALRREFREEFGIEIVVGDAFYAFTYMHGDAHVVEVDYFATLADPQAEIRLNPEDHSEYRWVNASELESIWGAKDDEYFAIQKGFALLADGE